MAPVASDINSFESNDHSFSNCISEKQNVENHVEELLRCDEVLDRSSPVLWPQPVPGLLEFIRKYQFDIKVDEEINEIKFNNLDVEDYDIIFYLRDKPHEMLGKIKELNDIAFQLDLEETKELAKGAILDIFNQSNDKNKNECNGYTLLN